MKAKLVIHPVDDLDACVRFYADTLKLAVKFRDGDRYCAIDAGGITLALVAGEERLVDVPALGYACESLDALHAAIDAATASGATVTRALEKGPHEWRAVLKDPAGMPFVVSAKL
ncbi:hypothetical protein PTE30175_05242 [Pandoraea terrae]|uniref:VOC domain-containing protein n=1 Tax=Pandoraea terrae TaxID=1537710 RepID=A0A5E4ZDU9_9BURK|nr:VOC family protein [Pandoraea terrae]VVE58450.1 hypothetical protein PTE30175_05242 [Pandoraea terrae]